MHQWAAINVLKSFLYGTDEHTIMVLILIQKSGHCKQHVAIVEQINEAK